MIVGLVELSSSHAECLYTQVLQFKKEGKFVVFIGNQQIWDRISFQSEFKDCFLLPEKASLKQLIKVKKYLKEHKIKEIRLNTASGKSVRNFLLLACTKHQTVSGILHNIQRLKTSSTQKMISKSVSKYLVLAKYLKTASKQFSKKASVSVLHLNQQARIHTKPLNKPKQEIWICVPGQVEHKRRDYASLMLQIQKQGLHQQLRFIFLGKSFHKHGDGPTIQSELENLQISNQVLMWPEFVSEKEFEQYLSASDFLLPLIHKQHPSYEQYQTQISGTFHLATAYEKPILMSDQIWEISELEHLRVNYKEEQLIQFINTLPERDQN